MVLRESDPCCDRSLAERFLYWTPDCSLSTFLQIFQTAPHVPYAAEPIMIQRPSSDDNVLYYPTFDVISSFRDQSTEEVARLMTEEGPTPIKGVVGSQEGCSLPKV